MKTFISKDQRWHAWRGTEHFLLSDEDNKVLTYHDTLDDMVNHLWLAGFKIVAREINQHIKASTRCKSCSGTGIYRHTQVLGWGMSTPEVPCRECLGTGNERKTK